MKDELKKKKEAHKKYIEEIFSLELIGMHLKRDNERVINETQILQGRFNQIIQENINLKAKNKQIQELHKKESYALSQENEILKGELVSLKVNLSSCKKNIEKLESEDQVSKTNITELKVKIDILKEKINDYKKKYSDLKNEIRQCNEYTEQKRVNEQQCTTKYNDIQLSISICAWL